MFLTIYTGILVAAVTGIVGWGLGVEWAERRQAQLEQNRREWDKLMVEERDRIDAYHRG